jgi:hypothetical protein
MDSYYVVQYDLDGKFGAVISGMGRNKGTWDASHSKRTAQRHARRLRAKDKEHIYKVEN